MCPKCDQELSHSTFIRHQNPAVCPGSSLQASTSLSTHTTVSKSDSPTGGPGHEPLEDSPAQGPSDHEPLDYYSEHSSNPTATEMTDSSQIVSQSWR